MDTGLYTLFGKKPEMIVFTAVFCPAEKYVPLV